MKITFANSLDRHHAKQNVWSDLDTTCMTVCGIPELFFVEKVNFEKKKTHTKKADEKKACTITHHAKELMLAYLK